METIELLEHIIRMQDVQNMQARTTEDLTKTLEITCQRIIDLENCVIGMNNRLASLDKPLGNNTTTRGKDCKVIPLNVNARIIAQELRDE